MFDGKFNVFESSENVNETVIDYKSSRISTTAYKLL